MSSEINMSFPPPPAIPGFEGVPDADNFAVHGLPTAEFVPIFDTTIGTDPSATPGHTPEIQRTDEGGSMLVDGLRVAYFGAREAIAARRSGNASERVKEAIEAQQDGQNVTGPDRQLVPSDMSKRQLNRFRRELEAQARRNRVNKAYRGSESQTTGMRARVANSGSAHEVNARFKAGEISRVERDSELQRIKSIPKPVMNREQRKADRDVQRSSRKFNKAIGNNQPNTIQNQDQTISEDAIDALREKEAVHGLRAFEFESQKSAAKSRIANKILGRTEDRASKHLAESIKLLDEAALHEQGLDADGNPSSTYMGVKAEIKRHQAVVAADRATRLKRINEKRRSGDDIKLRDRLPGLGTVARRTVKGVSLHAQAARESFADYRIARLRQISRNLHDRSFNGVARWSKPFVGPRYASPKARKNYSELSAADAQWASDIETSATDRRARKYGPKPNPAAHSGTTPTKPASPWAAPAASTKMPETKK